MFTLDDIAFAENKRTLNDIFQLSDIAWPGIPREQVENFRGNTTHLTRRNKKPVFLQKVVDQTRDLLGPSTQRWNHQRKNA